MAKKKNKRIVKAPKTEEIKPLDEQVEVVEPDVDTVDKSETEVKTENKKETKDNKTKAQKSKKEKGQNKLVKKTKETFSELKKVSWPSFKTVVKNTGVVIVVVLVFTLVLFGIDRGLAALYNLIPR